MTTYSCMGVVDASIVGGHTLRVESNCKCAYLFTDQ